MRTTQLLSMAFALTLACGTAALAQQEAQYTSFVYNKQYFNPATAGARGFASVSAIYRQQWIGFEGAPTSQMVAFGAPVLDDQIGFGLMLNHASKGIVDNVYASMAYNYKIRLSETHSLRLGLQGSLQRWGLDFTDQSVRVRDADDASIDLANNFSTWEGNVGVGAYLQLGEYFSAGVSSPHLYSSKIGLDASKGDQGARLYPHIYLMAEGSVPLSSKLAFRPAGLFKYVQGAPMDFDVNFGLLYADRVFGGLGYQVGGPGGGESVNLMVFYQVTDKIGLGGAYDIGVSELSSREGGTVEVMGRIDLGGNRDDLVNPRFF